MATNPSTDASTYQARLERARDEMARQSVDVLLLGPSADLTYLIGFNAHHSERLNLLIVPRQGTPSLIIPALEAPLLGRAADLVSVHAWADHENPAERAAAVIQETGPRSAAVGNQLWSAFLLRIQAHLNDLSWREAAPLMRELRMIKDATELAALQKAATRTDEAWEEFIQAGSLTGLTETEALARLKSITGAKGVATVWGLCASGPNSASPHHKTGDRVIQDGEPVLFDWGGTVDGYYSDVTRTLHVGEPSEEFRVVYDTVRQANQATLDAVQPGTPLQELDRAARGTITEAGYGEAFIHRVGHGLGREVHEEPYLVEGNTLPLRAGMVFSDEPGIYLEGRFGVRIEDTVVCTEDGGQRLNEATRELVIL